MKTKTFLIFLVIFIISWTTGSATTFHRQLNNLYGIEYFYVCASPNDTVIMHKPTSAITNIMWLTPTFSSFFAQDTVIITYTDQGNWSFSSVQVGKDFYVYFINTPPYQPTDLAHDTSFCTSSINWTMNATNTNTGATYLWDNGSTGQTRTITTTGTFWCRITNDCNLRTDTIHVTQGNPNAPHLGADQTFCWGSSAVLDPLSTNVVTYQWSTGETTPTIVIDTTGDYWVYVQDINGCSGKDTVHITALVPISKEECYVGFDPATWKNDINWPSVLPGNADSVRVYKEVSLNVWSKIGTVQKSINHFLDLGSMPQAQSYSYKISIVDTCGNESGMSLPHTTSTLMSAYDAPSHTYGFTWSAYGGLVVPDYYLFGIDSFNVATQVASVPGNVFMYNYMYPNPNYVKYFVGFETPDCNAKTNVLVRSNWVIRDSLLTDEDEVAIIPLSIYPNPVSNQLELSINTTDFDVQLINMLGQVLLTKHNQKMIDISMLPKGVYIVRVKIYNKINQQKIILQ